MNILIAGCGDIGAQTGLKLHALGHTIYGLKRHVESLPDQIRPIAADLSRPLAASVLPDDIDQVIFILAAAEFTPSAYRQAYVDGARHLIRALDKQILSLDKFIYVSSSSVYGQNNGEWIDEDSPAQPASFNGQAMLQGEQQITALPCGLCVRFSGIYGPGRTRMINQVKQGVIAPPAPVIYSNRIHSHDCAGVLAHLSQTPLDMTEKIILASDCQPAPLHDLQRWLALELGMDEQALTYKHPQRRAGSKRISNRRLRQSGYQFLYPDYQQGYQQMLDESREL